MKKLFAFSFLLLSFSNLFSQQNLKLWYKQPAKNWNEALPIGNGRLGAMVFGNVNEELLQLNEQTLWSGGPVNTNPNPMAPTYLPQIRKALDDEDYKLAEELTQKMQGLFSDAYEPLGDLIIHQTFSGEATNYYRDLNISTATSHTNFSVNDVDYTREQFVSAPDQVIIVHLTASKKGMLNFTASIKSLLYYNNTENGNNEIIMKGVAPSHSYPNYVQSLEIPVVYNDPNKCKGMRFELKIKAKSTDGKITCDSTGIHVQDATEAILFLSAATSFNGFDKCPDKDGKDEDMIANKYLRDAFNKNYDDLLKAHVEDYQMYFNRVSLQLDGSNNANLSTDERLKQYTSGASDVGLEALYFQFGRYLLISSSRPDGIPANLQGIWNNEVRPPWSCNYTTNINVEMNYWMAETANLSELHEALINQVQRLSITGKQTAKNFYNMPGWVVHHNSDIWALSNPVSGSPVWANWPMGSAWLCQHLWEHYMFTGDKNYLQKMAYPIMKDAAVFYLSWLIQDKNGYLVTAPSTSPENEFVTDKGVKSSVSVASTMDMSLIWDLFTNLIQASEHLNIDEDFRKILMEKRSKLFPLQIGKNGNLQEWYKDFNDSDPHHRHVSHLFGLFPGRELSPIETPCFAQAVKKSLEIRGDEGTGWSKGWKINLWARLLDGNHAHKLIREQLKLVPVEEVDFTKGGTYPNLLDACPPFQIDGNFGGACGFVEMLLQSQDGAVHLLPALPDEWKSGKVTGLKARGGFEIVSMEWKDGKIINLSIKSNIGGNLRLRLPNKIEAMNGGLKPAQSENLNPFYTIEKITCNDADKIVAKAMQLKPTIEYDLTTQAGKVYTFKN